MGQDDLTTPRRDFSYRDASDIDIAAYEWPAPDPAALVQISHGIGEHAKRYDAFARELTRAGFTVYADDHRGHGETGRRQYDGDLSKLGQLGPGGLQAAEAAILQLTGIAREAHPGLPVVMFGHSWGSLMAQRMLNVQPEAWDAVILSGSAFRTVRHMEAGRLNARWAGPEAGGFEWLSRDPEVGRGFSEDPLCFGAEAAKQLGVADALRLLGKPAPGLSRDVPILIVSGSEDPLSRGNGLQLLADAYRARGVRDVSLKVYPGARHEILNETNRDEVTTDLITWITDRVAGD